MRHTLIRLGLCAALCPSFAYAEGGSDAWTTAAQEAQEAARALGKATSESAEQAWDATKEYSGSAWERFKQESNRAWEATKDYSERTWEQGQEAYRDYKGQPPAPVEGRGGTATAATGHAPPVDLANATYAGIYPHPVTLTNGRYEGEPFVAGGASRPVVTLIDGLTARGDLNGDGAPDAAVLLVEDSGGSGSFVYLAAMGFSEAGARNLGTVGLGDRAQIRDLAVADGQILVDMVVAGEGDPMAFPAAKVRAHFRLADGTLKPTGSDDLGPLSAADLEGSDWTLREDPGTSAAPDPMAAIQIRFEGERIAGSAGCNRFFADLTDKGRGAIAIGPVGTTRMACPPPRMEREQAFLERLAKVDRFGFRFGDLVLIDPKGALLFAPKIK
jgi:heat shock protein HslJ